MEDAKAQLVDKLKSANNILVTVSRDPSVDQLSALLGLTLLLNKQGKHAAAVFSGEVPSTLEFLKPDETIEKNTDSLRDFIIALDKSKADKLRYKVEDNVVRIFITPFRTSISKDDFEFSQGDFNVDLVVALGVQKQEDVDEAIVAHGRILHDAAVATVNLTSEGGDLGTINWQDPKASSLSELVTRIGEELGENLLDEQIATALLTGIVAETDRFSNQKTTPETMSASAALMSAGANQQLVASKLDEKAEPGAVDLQSGSDQPASPDGALDIAHEEPAEAVPESTDDSSDIKLPEPTIESLPSEAGEGGQTDSNMSTGSKLVTEPPTLGGTLTANTQQEVLDPSTDPLSLPAEEPPLLERQHKVAEPGTETTPESAPAPEPVPEPTPAEVGPTSAPPLAVEPSEPAASPAPTEPTQSLSEPAQPEPPLPAEPSAAVTSQFTPPPPAWVPPAPDPLNLGTPQTDDDHDNQTLTEIEQAVDSPHVDQAQLGSARDEVNKALTESTATPEPIQALNAQPLGKELRPEDLPTDPGPSPAATAPIDPNAPPPVPPPIPFQFGNPPAQQ
jgi:hypothetical protein